jgi:hypothetical protein
VSQQGLSTKSALRCSHLLPAPSLPHLAPLAAPPTGQVMLLRERHVWGPPSCRSQLRRALLHLLATGPAPHSRLALGLPYEQGHHRDFTQAIAGGCARGWGSVCGW